jgi:hypothetical protein
MDASAIIAFAAFSATLGGFALKKSWLLWLAIPLFFLLFLYWAYLETWFVATAQHSIILLSIGTTAGLAFSAIRMMSKPAIAKSGLDEDADEDDSELMEYQRERAQYDRLSKAYGSHKRGRR